jgi:4'-phosphopantetheinyl transferase
MLVPKNPVTWQTATKNLVLFPEEIHIWRVDLNRWKTQAHFILNHLSPEELQRGQRLIQEKHRHRFYTAKAFLRLILAQYLSVKPLDLLFREGNFGKPFLGDENAPLYFNMTHSEDLALYAVSGQFEVGIDVEHLNRLQQLEPLIERCLTPSETQFLSGLAEDLRQEYFYYFWTRKEAYLKTLGWGLSRLESASTLSSLDIPMVSFKPSHSHIATIAWQNPHHVDATQIHFLEPV